MAHQVRLSDQTPHPVPLWPWRNHLRPVLNPHVVMLEQKEGEMHENNISIMGDRSEVSGSPLVSTFEELQHLSRRSYYHQHHLATRAIF